MKYAAIVLILTLTACQTYRPNGNVTFRPEPLTCNASGCKLKPGGTLYTDFRHWVRIGTN